MTLLTPPIEAGGLRAAWVFTVIRVVGMVLARGAQERARIARELHVLVATV